MAEMTVVLSDRTHSRLQELAGRSGRPVAEVLERAVDELHWREFWAIANADYERMWADPIARAEEEAERAAWEVTLADGLDDDDIPPGPGAPS